MEICFTLMKWQEINEECSCSTSESLGAELLRSLFLDKGRLGTFKESQQQYQT